MGGVKGCQSLSHNIRIIISNLEMIVIFVLTFQIGVTYYIKIVCELKAKIYKENSTFLHLGKIDLIFDNLISIRACYHQLWHIHETAMCQMIGMAPTEGLFTRSRLLKFIKWSKKNKTMISQCQIRQTSLFSCTVNQISLIQIVSKIHPLQ